MTQESSTPEPREEPVEPRQPPPPKAPPPAKVRKPREPRQGAIRRVIDTPLRDLARGQATGACNLRYQLHTSELPAQLRTIVADVVRRTRLWRSERADVSTELIAHFRDGLEAGEKSEALAVAFGPVRRAAKLIRRAKKRNRSLLWKSTLRTAQVVGLLLAIVVGVYLVATVRLFTGTPTDQPHDYLADLNAMALAVPAEQRAWPRYREALVQLELSQLSPERRDVTARPGDASWYAVADFLEEHQDALALVRDASRRPGLGYVAGYEIDPDDLVLWPELEAETAPRSFGLASMLLPYLAELRGLSQVLALDAHRAAAAADGAVTAADISAILSIAEQVREVPILLNDLVSVSAITIGVTTLGEILTSQPEIFTDEQLQALAHQLAALHGGRIEIRLDSERMWFQDIVQRLYTDDGDGDGRLTASGLESLSAIDGGRAFQVGPLAPVLGLVIAGRRDMTEEFTKWISRVEAENAKPLWRQDSMRLEGELARLSESKLYTARYLPVVLLTPALGRAGRNAEVVAQQRDALCVAIAMELYRRTNGGWPETLAELVPQQLPRIPLDRLDGRPLRYRPGEPTPVLYSVGADRDDDEGREARDPAGRTGTRLAGFWGGDPIDGDWVLFPVKRSVARVGDPSGRAETPETPDPAES